MTVYTETELLRLAKRAHNTKRTYLLIDPLQGKHLSVSPEKAIGLFHTLGKKIRKEHREVKLVIGFAETATAIGMAVAEEMDSDCVYIHTTREDITDVSSWIEFHEEHSHAVDQKLDASKLEKWIKETDCIVFVDDEISTGKTLINFVGQLRERFKELAGKKLIAASVIDRLSGEHRVRMEQNGIESISVLKLENTNYEEYVKKYTIEDACEPEKEAGAPCYKEIQTDVKLADPRRGVPAEEYRRNCVAFAKDILEKTVFPESVNSVLTIGTEECMYPAIILGREIEDTLGIAAFTHSTTRSPIGICQAEDYPICNGYRLKSFYDKDRVTYIYNIKKYDRVIIVTDSRSASEEAIGSLVDALRIYGNDEIILVRG